MRVATALVTGGLGCIGAWTARHLLMEGDRVVVLDPSDNSGRLRRLVPPELLDRVALVSGDISDLATVEGVLADHRVERIVHLAALQIPFCRADPHLGAQVNVVGTVSVFEAARRAGISHVVYTSSVAVFDQDGGPLGAGAVPNPTSFYGVYKLANEGTASAYWNDFEFPSIGVRPMTVYGPGRDRGLTSSPTKAIVAAVLGARYEIAFGGTTFLHYAGDVGGALATAARTPVEGAPVVNLNGVTASVADIVESLRRRAGDSADGITLRPDPIPFPDDVDTTGLDILGPPPVTPLDDGIAATLAFFHDLKASGQLVPEEHGLTVTGDLATDLA